MPPAEIGLLPAFARRRAAVCGPRGGPRRWDSPAPPRPLSSDQGGAAFQVDLLIERPCQRIPNPGRRQTIARRTRRSEFPRAPGEQKIPGEPSDTHRTERGAHSSSAHDRAVPATSPPCAQARPNESQICHTGAMEQEGALRNSLERMVSRSGIEPPTPGSFSPGAPPR